MSAAAVLFLAGAAFAAIGLVLVIRSGWRKQRAASTQLAQEARRRRRRKQGLRDDEIEARLYPFREGHR